MPLSPNLRAALFMTVSMAGFTVNDGVTKYMSEVMNMGQVMFLRGAFATLFVAALAWHQGALSNLRLFGIFIGPENIPLLGVSIGPSA